jgi:ferric-dicitrate binding protein FerR (iron transport regulator)
MNTSEKDQFGKDDKVLEALFRHASTRQRAPLEVEKKIREKLHSEWRHVTRRRRVRRNVAGWAIAASVVLALFMSVSQFRQPDPLIPGPVLATVDKRAGDVFIQSAAGETSGLPVDAQLRAGSELSTIQDARIALAWASGESLRMDQNSRISLTSNTEISLLSGKIYIDAAGAGIQGRALVINTPSGPVSHIGTQYITTVSGDEVTVSVREGKVSIGSGDEATIAVQGQRLHLADNGQHLTTAIPVYGDEWQWTELIAPRFNVDGRTMQEFLDWVGRETGRKIEYGSIESELAAAQTRMHGNIDLEPLHAMELMLQTSDLTAVVKDGVILVSL